MVSKEEANIDKLSYSNLQILFSLVFVVFFSTVSTVIIITTLPLLFFKLQLTYKQIGYIDGLAAFVSFFSKFFSGICADKVTNRKSILVCGTFLSILTKASFAIVTGFGSLIFVRISDRLAKGIRSSTIDAVIADLASKKRNGLFFGFKYTLFMLGGICGGITASFLLRVFQKNFIPVMFFSIIPAIVAFWLSKRIIENPKEKNLIKNNTDDLKISKKKWLSKYTQNTNWKRGYLKEKTNLGAILKSFDPMFWKFLLVVFFLMFARFSETFVMVKSLKIGIARSEIPLLTVLYDFFALCSALIFSLLSIKISKRKILLAALFMHCLAHFIFFFAYSKKMMFLGVISAGIHLGMSQGILLAIISEFTSPNNRATAFSFYYLVAGSGVLGSNIIAGFLNDFFNSPSPAFLEGAIFSALSWYFFKNYIKKIGQEKKTFISTEE